MNLLKPLAWGLGGLVTGVVGGIANEMFNKATKPSDLYPMPPPYPPIPRILWRKLRGD
jgi:hypothetical protein